VAGALKGLRRNLGGKRDILAFTAKGLKQGLIHCKTLGLLLQEERLGRSGVIKKKKRSETKKQRTEPMRTKKEKISQDKRYRDMRQHEKIFEKGSDSERNQTEREGRTGSLSRILEKREVTSRQIYGPGVRHHDAQKGKDHHAVSLKTALQTKEGGGKSVITSVHEGRKWERVGETEVVSTEVKKRWRGKSMRLAGQSS